MFSPNLASTLRRFLVSRTPLTFCGCLRNASGRVCLDPKMLPRCSKAALADTECMAELEGKVEPKWVNPFRHLIESDECCPPPCPEFPRFDDMYYKERNNLNRKYQQTWKECPDCLFRPKKICCPPPPPRLVRRPRRVKPKTACEPKKKCPKEGPCMKLKMPCCRPARDPPTCRKEPRPKSNCKKRCAPLPSFSECVKQKFRIPRPTECLCLRIPESCVIYAEIEKIKRRGLGKKCAVNPFHLPSAKRCRGGQAI